MSTYDRWLTAILGESIVSKDLSITFEFAVSALLFLILWKVVRNCTSIRVEKFEDYYSDESRFLITDY